MELKRNSDKSWTSWILKGMDHVYKKGKKKKKKKNKAHDKIYLP